MFGKKKSEQDTKNQEGLITAKTDDSSMQADGGEGAGESGSSVDSAAAPGGSSFTGTESSPFPTAAAKKKKGKKKKRIIIGIVVVVAVAVVLKMVLGGGEVVMPTPTSTVARMDVQQVISIKGSVEGNDSAEVTSALDREIVSISVKEGDTVSKGQLLATLKDKEDTSNRTQKYDIQQAQNNLESAKFDYDTAKKLYDEGVTSLSEFQKAETAYENAKSALASSKVDRTVSEDLRITSPISGIVTRVNAKVGFTASQMQSGTALFVVEDLSSLKMQVKASEYDISKIQVGQKVTISAEVLGDGMAEGVVSHIAPTGELKDNSGKEMVIPVKIDITPGSGLIAGVTAKADILVAESKNTLAIPLDALGTDQATGESYIFTVSKDNKLKKEIITTGLESDFYIEVTSDNIKEGDRFVLNPTPDLTDGQTIVLEGQADGAGGEDGDAAPDGAAAE